MLQTIAKKLEGEVVSGMEQEELLSTVFRYISNFHGSVVSINTATILVQTLVALTVLPGHEDFSEQLGKFSFVSFVRSAFPLFQDD